MTFKDFLLLEIDIGDLELARQQTNQQAAQAARSQGKDEFAAKMKGSTPVENDVIQGKSGYYIVKNVSPEGITVTKPRSIGGGTQIFPPGSKFKNTGKKTDGGGAIFFKLR